MTPPIVQRLRDAAAALQGERVSMRAMAQAHGPDAQGTLLLLLAMPCLLPVPGVGKVLGLGMAALAVAMWRGQCSPSLPRRVAELELPRHWAQRVLVGLASAYVLAGRYAKARSSHLAISGRRSGPGRQRPRIIRADESHEHFDVLHYREHQIHDQPKQRGAHAQPLLGLGAKHQVGGSAPHHRDFIVVRLSTDPLRA